MSRNRLMTVLVVVVLCLSLLSLSGLAGVGGVAAQEAEPDEPDESDSTHQHPDEANEEGDAERVAKWLQDRLSSSHDKSTVHLEEGEYEQARKAVGDDYDDYLSQYVEVSGETDEANEEQAEEYKQAREEQTQLINDVEEYEETHKEYQEAREAGNDERARKLARDLEDLSQSIDERSESLQQHHKSIEEKSGTDTSDARESIEQTDSNVESTQEEVRDSEFIPTELSVSADSTNASFDDPMVINGQITTTDGTPVANEPIVLEIGDRTVSTTTNASGEFSVEYRPVTEPVETTEIDVRYTPDTQSDYASAETTLPVTIEQAEPDVTITGATDGAAFGEEFTVKGVVESAGIGIDSVPVIVFVDGEPLGEVETAEDGAFELTATLPANVSAGEVDVHAQVALEERALARGGTVAPVEVSKTPGAIDVTAEHRDDLIYLQGSLTTEDGTPVGGQPVDLVLDGETVTTVETAEGGTYETLVAVPDDAGATVSVDAVYAEDGSNVGNASATADVRVGEVSAITQIVDQLGISGGISSLEVSHWLMIAGLLILGGLGVYRLLDPRNRSDDFGPGPGSASAMGGGNASGASGRSSIDLPATLLNAAREQAQAGDANRAVERAYLAMRQGIDGDGRRRTETHWEFYQDCLNDGFPSEQVDALRSLTERFEQATFSTWGVSTDDAQEAIEEAKAIVRRG